MLTRPKTKSIVTTQKMAKSLLLYCFLCLGHQPEQRNAFSFGKTSAYTPHYPRVPYQAVTKPTDSIYIWQNDDPPNSSFKNEIDSVNSEKQKMYGTRKLVEDTIKYAQDTKQNVLDSDMYTEEISYFGECDETINWNSGCRVCKVDMISNARTAQPTISPSPFVSTTGTSNDLNTIPPTVTPSPSVKSPHEVLAGATPNPTVSSAPISPVRALNQTTDFAIPEKIHHHVYFSSCPANFSSETDVQHRHCLFGFPNVIWSSIKISADHNYEILLKASSTEDEVQSIVDKLEISMSEEVTARLMYCDFKVDDIIGDTNDIMFYSRGTISKYDLAPSDSLASTHCNQLNRHESDSRCFVIKSSSTVYYNPDAFIVKLDGIFPFIKAEKEIKDIIRKTIGDGCTNGIFNITGISKCQIIENDFISPKPSPPYVPTPGLGWIGDIPTPLKLPSGASPGIGGIITPPTPTTNEKSTTPLLPLSILFVPVIFALKFCCKNVADG